MSDSVPIEQPATTAPLATIPPKQEKAKSDYQAFLNAHPFVRQTVVDKIYGCIIGSALGDTIGLYTEFMTKSQSERVYPDRKFQLVEPATELYPDSHRTRFAPCAWTDDTDQALLIVLSYIYNYTHATSNVDPATHANDALGSDFAVRLRIWITQGLLALNRHACGIGALVGSVVTNAQYLEDPADIATKKWMKSGRNAAPNGSLMRTHPIGVIGVALSEEETWKLSVDVGWTTHVDPRCTVSCCIEVALIRGLLRGEILDEEGVNRCIERSYEWVNKRPDLMNPGHEELTEWEIKRLLDRKEFDRHVYADTLEDLKLDSSNTIGYVYKCIGSAILLLRLAMRKASSTAGGPLNLATLFEDLTVDLIMEGGDSDTNGAAACALLGAYLGYANLPSHWTLGLAHKEWFVSKTYRLAVASGVMEKSSLKPEADEAPDGGRGLMSDVELTERWLTIYTQNEKRKKDLKEGANKEKEKKKKSGFGWFSS